MAVVQSVTASFKRELMEAVHDFQATSVGGDVFKLALYTSSASLDPSTTVYTTANEVVGTGYTAGGATLTNLGVFLSGSTAYTDFENAVWPGASFTAAAALLYNASQSNRTVAVFNFGGSYTCTNQSFTVEFPPASSTTAVLILV